MIGYRVRYGDVFTRMPSLHGSRLFLLSLFFNVWQALPKTIPYQETLVVLIRVQVFDNSDLLPLVDAAVEVYGNHSTLASSKTGSDGMLMVSFQYTPRTWIMVTASKRGYVANSTPWHASSIPLYSSVSLYLLPQRPATLIFYDDIVQVLQGSPGASNQPWVQFKRSAVHLPINSSYTDLSAVLTVTKSQNEFGGFPYLLGHESNGTGGNGSWVDLTAVAAISTHLFTYNGNAIQVSEPIHFSVPLPSDSLVKSATSIPLWGFDGKTGLWVRNGTGYIKKEGEQLVWSFVAAQLGNWVAAVPSSEVVGLNLTGLQDIAAYHTIFLLTILGSVALVVLILLCLLLYYCRRRCLKPRQHLRKMHASCTLDPSKRDQGTSTSHLNLISGGTIETASFYGDIDPIKSDFVSSQDLQTSREEFLRHVPAQKLRHMKFSAGTRTPRCESIAMKVTRSMDTNNLDPPLLCDDYTRGSSSMKNKGSDSYCHHNANDNQGYASDPPSPPHFTSQYQNHRLGSSNPAEYSILQSTDHSGHPTSLSTQPGQFIFCGSIDQMNETMYRSMVPTLVIPAHYMQPSPGFSGVDKEAELQQQQQKKKMDDQQVSMSIQQQQLANPPSEDPQGQGWTSDPSSGPMRIPVLFNDSTMAQMNGELQALTEKKLLELGVKQHPRAWFISLDGRSNSHVRHSYIDPGNERSRRGSSDTGLDLGVTVEEGRTAKYHKKGERSSSRGGIERKGHGNKACSKLSSVDDTQPSSSESHTALCSPEDNSLTPVLDEVQVPPGATIPRWSHSRVSSSRSSNSETRQDSWTSPEDEIHQDDRDDEGENKKSPWQRREERPLMVFNVKK